MFQIIILQVTFDGRACLLATLITIAHAHTPILDIPRAALHTIERCASNAREWRACSDYTYDTTQILQRGRVQDLMYDHIGAR